MNQDIRQKFLKFFETKEHLVYPSASLKSSDPGLLFNVAGMQQFKPYFQGATPHFPGYGTHHRVATSQKCMRAGGKDSDIENVGRTRRHHTFFEMLGNFSFGDYFKRDAIRFAWEFLTEELGMPRERLWVTVHYSDDEAAALWLEIAGLPPERIFRLGDEDNFWQMADTGPCGPCSEVHFDLRPEEERGTEVEVDEFVERGEKGEFLEIWNLVFMQSDRDADGALHPLPAPSIDTGAGLERIAAVMQGAGSNYETDLFRPLITAAADRIGVPYRYETPEGGSYRVLADHARATAFLLADGVYPSNEGRGYVLRRILRRAVRHAWLLGRREPTLVDVVADVVDLMKDVYPELGDRREHLLRTTRAEEERFLATIGEGMKRFDEIAPRGGSGTVSGEDTFRLYDTFGFPLDLTELMAAERGYAVDIAGFESELAQQRARSRQDRAAAGIGVGDDLSDGWVTVDESAQQEFRAYSDTAVDTEVLAFRESPGTGDARTALRLRENPFYAESGGQISDSGQVHGDGWRMRVEEVRRVGGQIAVIGPIEGDFRPGPVRAEVDEPVRRDTERNHTATHLLHAALRRVLGDHVVQQGSLVAPDRLRFDFLHTGPMTVEQIAEVERLVNEAIWANEEVCTHRMGYSEAIGRGAMALFSEKYGDVVRVVEVPGVSLELCGGTHVRTTGQIGAVRIVSESGVAAGVRRIEAVTGPLAYQRALADRDMLRELAATMRTREENLPARARALVDEHRELQKQLERARAEGGADRIGGLIDAAQEIGGVRVVTGEVELEGAEAGRKLGDLLRDRLGSGVAVVGARNGGRAALYAVATDDVISRGLRADVLIREVSAAVGGKGGGRPHLAQAGLTDIDRLEEALANVPEVVRRLLSGGGA